MIDSKKLAGLSGAEYVASVPEGEQIVSVVEHKGSLYVCSSKSLYVLRDEKRLEPVLPGE